MKTPRILLSENKNQIQDEIRVSLLRRLIFEMLQAQGMDLYLDMDTVLSDEFIERYQTNKARVLKDEPLGYVLGYEWFYGLKLKVNEHVLIPRSETEELAGHVSADVFDYFDQDVVIADIATGSGALACALKSDHDTATVIASDISPAALKVAQANAKAHDLDIQFYQGDMGDPLIEAGLRFDVIVCNPPYIRKDEIIESSVKDFEPHLALYGGDDGLHLYRKLLNQIPNLIKKRAMVAFEIGFDQKQALLDEINKRFERVRVEVVQDINQKDRMFFMYFNLAL